MFVINSKWGAEQVGDMTDSRVDDFVSGLSGTITLPARATLPLLEKLLKKTHACHLVSAAAVPLSAANPFLQLLAQLDGIAIEGEGDVAAAEDDDEVSWQLRCDCGAFWHNANVCSHVVAVADELGALAVDTLLTKLGGRRKVGRPETHHGDCLDRGKAPPPRFHSAEWHSAECDRKGELRFHKWRIVRIFAEAEEFVGVVWGYRERSGPGIKKHGLWNIRYEEFADTDDEFEELTKEELCDALALASRRGVAGPSAKDLAPRVI